MSTFNSFQEILDKYKSRPVTEEELDNVSAYLSELSDTQKIEIRSLYKRLISRYYQDNFYGNTTLYQKVISINATINSVNTASNAKTKTNGYDMDDDIRKIVTTLKSIINMPTPNSQNTDIGKEYVKLSNNINTLIRQMNSCYTPGDLQALYIQSITLIKSSYTEILRVCGCSKEEISITDQNDNIKDFKSFYIEIFELVFKKFSIELQSEFSQICAIIKSRVESFVANVKTNIDHPDVDINIENEKSKLTQIFRKYQARHEELNGTIQETLKRLSNLNISDQVFDIKSQLESLNINTFRNFEDYENKVNFLLQQLNNFINEYKTKKRKQESLQEYFQIQTTLLQKYQNALSLAINDKNSIEYYSELSIDLTTIYNKFVGEDNISIDSFRLLNQIDFSIEHKDKNKRILDSVRKGLTEVQTVTHNLLFRNGKRFNKRGFCTKNEDGSLNVYSNGKKSSLQDIPTLIYTAKINSFDNDNYVSWDDLSFQQVGLKFKDYFGRTTVRVLYVSELNDTMVVIYLDENNNIDYAIGTIDENHKDKNINEKIRTVLDRLPADEKCEIPSEYSTPDSLYHELDKKIQQALHDRSLFYKTHQNDREFDNHIEPEIVNRSGRPISFSHRL